MALSTGTTRYLLDGLSVIAQYAPSGSRQALYVQSLARIDEVLSVTNGSGKYWYQTDALGSVYALTTQAGEVRARGGYDVFGESVALSGTAVGQPFGFTGREHEVDSGLTYHRDRYMRPQSANWTQPDRLASQSVASDAAQRAAAQVPLHAWRFSAALGTTFSGMLPSHAYGYAGSDPVGLTDLSGFAAKCFRETWIGAPLLFGELAFGPLAAILFVGVYSSIDTPHQVLVISLLAEVGLFFETDKWLRRKPYELGVSAELGLGAGMERDVAREEFEEEVFVERVYQIGPVVIVYGANGESVFITNHFGLGGGALIGGGWVNWVVDL